MLGFEPSDEGSIPSERSIYRSVAELADAAVSKTAEATRPDSTSGGATKCRSGGKADTLESESNAREGVRVQISPSVPMIKTQTCVDICRSGGTGRRRGLKIPELRL